MKQHRGLAMVIVLWIISLLTIMAGSFTLTMRRETTVISAIKDNAVALALAETGVTVAQQMMLLPDHEKRWATNGQVYHFNYQESKIRVKILAAHGKVDINTAEESILTQLLSVTELEEEAQQALVNAIMDWRDDDDLIRIQGAEKKQYDEAGLTYQPRNKAFQSIDELQMVLGMTADLFKKIQPLVTIYSGLKKVDIRFASGQIKQLISGNQLEGETDINPDEIESEVIKKTPPVALKHVYTIISQAQLFDDMTATLQVTLKKVSKTAQSGAFQIINWQTLYEDHSLFDDESTSLIIE